MKEKESKAKDSQRIKNPNLPSTSDNEVDIMSKNLNNKKENHIKDKKHSFPPIDYEKPPHY